MGYWEVSEMARDADLAARVQACAATLLDHNRDAIQWQGQNMLMICSHPEWDTAWSRSTATGRAKPGQDTQVITDQMILTAVTDHLAETDG